MIVEEFVCEKNWKVEDSAQVNGEHQNEFFSVASVGKDENWYWVKDIMI